jgi:hypothetical protein
MQQQVTKQASKVSLVHTGVFSAVLTVSAIVGIGSFLLAMTAPYIKEAIQSGSTARAFSVTDRFRIAASLDLAPASLIKGASSKAVYFLGDDAKRYVFPNEKTYNTWYPNFSTVITIPDGDLAKFPLGKNVTYRPGVKLVKIQSVNKVYAVDNGAYLRWIPTEQLAKDLYGTTWNKQVEDIPVTFFIDYTTGPDLKEKKDFNRQNVLVASPDIVTDWKVWKVARAKAEKETKQPTVFPQQIVFRGGGGGGGGSSSGGGGGRYYRTRSCLR